MSKSIISKGGLYRQRKPVKSKAESHGVRPVVALPAVVVVLLRQEVRLAVLTEDLRLYLSAGF